MKKNKITKNSGLGSGLSSLLGSEFEKKSIKQVSLFYRTDSQPRYREISFPAKSKRYSYTYNPKKNPANYITYFFTVELVDGKVFATPLKANFF